MINAGVIKQEDENTFVVANQDQEQRFEAVPQPDQGWEELWYVKDSILFDIEIG